MEAKIKSIYNKLKMKPPEWIPEIDKEIFKVGKQEGIREVVEWIEERVMTLDEVILKPIIYRSEWQAKLKEWEV